MIKLDLVVGVVVFALWVYCLIEVISSSEGEIRNLPKIAWIFLVLLFPLVGSVAWLVAGRPDRRGRRLSAYEREAPRFPEYDRPGRAAGATPESDDEFLRRVRERAEEQRRRAREQREREQD